MSLALAGRGNQYVQVQAATNADFYGTNVVFDSKLAKRIPAEWKGSISVPVKVLQPNAYIDEQSNTIGMKPDLMKALSTLWGIPIHVETVSFDGHVPGVLAQRYAFKVSTGDHEQRRAVLDIVDYSKAGVAWLTRADSGLRTKDDTCGHVIGVIKGMGQEQRAHEKVTDCASRGIPGTEVIGFSNTIVTVPLQAKRIDVAYGSLSQMVYFAKTQPDEFRFVGEPEAGAPLALGVQQERKRKSPSRRTRCKRL